MKISVIIPVYNAQNSIKRALESVLSQSYQDFEIILVDDGSKDDSLQIINSFAKDYSCIRVFSQVNAGPGRARGKGIEHATGEYLFFLDADDYLPEAAFESLIAVVQEHAYDIVKGMYYNCRGDAQMMVRFPWTEGIVSPSGTKEEIERYQQIKTSSAFGYLWGTLYKKAFLDKTGISLAEIPLTFMEDTVFNLELFSCEPEYYVLCKPVYVYTIQENSLSSKKDAAFFQQVSSVIAEYDSFLKRKDCYKKNLDLLIPLAARCFSWACISTVTNQKIGVLELSKQIKTFATQRFMREILQEKTLGKMLWAIDSKAQALVYWIFCMLLRWKAYGVLAVMFIVLQVPMNAYVREALK